MEFIDDEAKKSLISVKSLASVGVKKVADAIKNEIVDVIKKVESLNKGRLILLNLQELMRL